MKIADATRQLRTLRDAPQSDGWRESRQKHTNIGNDRPDASGISQDVKNSTTERWFNTEAFVLQPIYQFGNAGRNTVTSPAGFILDTSLQKNFNLPKEGHELQFHWEAYNSFNHPVWGNPNTSLSSVNYGRITSTSTTMRQLQFTLKYVF